MSLIEISRKNTWCGCYICGGVMREQGVVVKLTYTMVEDGKKKTRQEGIYLH